MVHHRLGHVKEAGRLLAKSDAYCGNQPINDALAATPLRLSLDWVWGPILWREAKELIEGKPPLADPRLRLLRAKAYTQLGEPKKAEAEFQAAVAARPTDPAIWHARARLFAQLGWHERAEADFAKVLELKPNDPKLWIERGRYLAERGQHQKADAHFAQAAKLTPDELNRFLEAGWWVAGTYPEALTLPCPPEKEADPSRPVPAFNFFPAVPAGSPAAAFDLVTATAAAYLPWKVAPTGTRGQVDVGQVFGNPGHVSFYALNYIYSPDERSMILRVGGADAVRLWLNGRLVYESTTANTSSLPQVSVTLRPGRNSLLAKVSNTAPPKSFLYLRADDPLDRGVDLAAVGLWKEAALFFAKGFERQPPDDLGLWSFYAVTLMAAGDEEGYHRHCVEMLKRFGQTSDVRHVNDICRDCCLSPRPVADPAELVKLAMKALTIEPKAAWRHQYLALVQYRAGQYKEAVARLTEYPGAGIAACVLALSYHRLGQTEKAREWLSRADRWSKNSIEHACTQSSLKISPPYWNLYAIVQILRREAHQLIDGKP